MVLGWSWGVLGWSWGGLGVSWGGLERNLIFSRVKGGGGLEVLKEDPEP